MLINLGVDPDPVQVGHDEHRLALADVLPFDDVLLHDVPLDRRGDRHAGVHLPRAKDGVDLLLRDSPVLEFLDRKADEVASLFGGLSRVGRSGGGGLVDPFLAEQQLAEGRIQLGA